MVTGPVVSGYSLTGLPSSHRHLHPDGQLRLVSTGITNTLATSASNSAVVPDHLHRHHPHV